MKISDFLPPIISRPAINFLKKNEDVWSGDFESWSDASLESSGYNQQNILETCSNSMNQVVNGQAIYERDGVIFNKKQYSWPLITTLLKIALENKSKLCVIDFGGALGSTYYQNKEFLNGLDVDWCIIEQENYVDEGKRKFETHDLHFFYTIEECLNNHSPSVVIFSSVLQYLEKPYEIISLIKKNRIQNILIDRTSFIEEQRNFITKQRVPSSIYIATYPMWFFNEKSFIEFFLPEYEVEYDFESYCDESTLVNKTKRAYWKGFLITRNNEI